ncbi:MAG TPA: glycosyltransferase family 4 protein, partial [Ilumatobacteraceae bacterium]|nr:glycosyltransferase family 4 protein [Ilumatobacteraceae bacterium]
APVSGPLRVAYVVTHYPRLAQTFIADEIKALRAAGVEVVTTSVNRPEPSDVSGPEGRREEAATLYLKSVGPLAIARALVAAMRRGPGPLLAVWWALVGPARFDVRAVVVRTAHLVEGVLLWAHCRRLGVRHLHAHFGGGTSNAAWCAVELARRIETERWTWSMTVHGLHDFMNERDCQYDRKAASASFIVAVSDFTRSQLLRTIDPADWPKARVIRCGIDLGAFELRPTPNPSPVPTLLMVGRLAAEKGHLVFVEALALLAKRGVVADARIVGDGPFRDEIEEAARRFGVAEHVHMMGERPPAEVRDLLTVSDVFCLPSFAEGLPVAMIEAMAIGTPVAATFISGIPELAVDDRTAVVMPAGDADAFADGVERLLTDPAHAREMALAARRRVEERHDLHTNIAQLVTCIAEAR